MFSSSSSSGSGSGSGSSSSSSSYTWLRYLAPAKPLIHIVTSLGFAVSSREFAN